MDIHRTLEHDALDRVSKVKHLVETGIFTNEDIEEIKVLVDNVWANHVSKA